MNIFKGFIPLKGKRPIEEYKDRKDFYSYEYARRDFEEYGGVLEDHIVQIDIDNMMEAEKVKEIVTDLRIKCAILKTTRGMHFYFKNTDIGSRKVKAKTPIGVTIDVGLGSKNAVVPLKMNNHNRRWLQKYDEVEELPLWIKPIRGGKRIPEFSRLGDGDGRNQELFNYILFLQTQGLNKESIKDTLRIINKYILKKPLKANELETIMRDEAFMKEVFYENNRFLHHNFANFIKEEEHIIKISNMLHIYREGVYTTQNIEAAMIKHIPDLNKAKRAEVISYLEIIAENKEHSDARYIGVANGILDIETMEIKTFSPDFIIQNKINYDYVNSAYDETTDKTLNKICNQEKELRLLLEEIIGYLLFRRNELGKAFILIGEGSNGKSTFLDMIKSLLGGENYSSLGIEELGERFKTAEVFNKLANIGDDISKRYIDDNAVFKKLVTGESVNVERKGKDPFEFSSYAKLVFSANRVPRINDTSNGLMRRLVIIPFNAEFSREDEDFDPFIKDKLLTKSSMEYLLRLGIEGLKRVLDNRGLTECKASSNELREYEVMNNPVLSFINEGNKIHNEPNNIVYLRYSVWCQENGFRAINNIEFGRELCKRGYESKGKRVEGKVVRIYEKREG